MADIEITGQPRKEWLNAAEYKSISLASSRIEDRTVDGVASVFGNVDDVGDITHKGAFSKTIQENFKRVKFLWNHDFNQPPTARIDELKEIGRDDLPIEVKAQFPEATGGLFVRRTYLNTPRGDELLAGVKAGAITEMSYGFNATQKDFTNREGKSIRNIRQARLLDVSDVQWGVNSATVARKGALPYHETPKAGADTAWDGPAQTAKASVDDLKAMCAWVDSENAENKGAYKLPHHEASGDHAVVWNGVKAAMGALMGARGGTDIPAGDRKGVYNHLAKHYEQFGETPPDYKMLEIAYAVKDARALLLAGVDFKAGRMISAANEEKIKSVIDAIEQQLETLEDLLGAAEPPDQEADQKSLTDPSVMLALLELDLKAYLDM